MQPASHRQVPRSRYDVFEAPRTRSARLRGWTRLHGAAWCGLAAAAVVPLYASVPGLALAPFAAGATLAALVSAFAYLRERPSARALVWPRAREPARAA